MNALILKQNADYFSSDGRRTMWMRKPLDFAATLVGKKSGVVFFMRKTNGNWKIPDGIPFSLHLLTS
jgi:hypothetical protein